MLNNMLIHVLHCSTMFYVLQHALRSIECFTFFNMLCGIDTVLAATGLTRSWHGLLYHLLRSDDTNFRSFLMVCKTSWTNPITSSRAETGVKPLWKWTSANITISTTKHFECWKATLRLAWPPFNLEASTIFIFFSRCWYYGSVTKCLSS